MDDTVLKIALGGMLHDIGKFMQRAELEKKLNEIKANYDEFCPLIEGRRYGYLHAAHTAYFIENFMPESILSKEDKKELYNAARHHKNPAGDIYREADCLSAGMERYPDEKDSDEYKKVRFHSIFDAIELQYAIRDRKGLLNSRWRYRLTGFSKKDFKRLYPVMDEKTEKVNEGGFSYSELWDSFQKELEAIEPHGNLGTYFNALYWLIEKYTWCIPSATNMYPDISLFDHLKTTASIASCFNFTHQEMDKGKPAFILYAGDISGIQDYIFRINRLQGVGGIAKRIRGRSFYIAVVADVFSRYIIHMLGLTVANINYSGGGNFEILLPNTKRVVDFIGDLTMEINQWLTQEFYGSLGYIDARVDMTTDELCKHYGEKRDDLADQLKLSKLRKNLSQIQEDSFWVDGEKIDGKITICPSCNLKLIWDKDSICRLCQQDKEIGQLLPQAEYLIFSQSEADLKNDGLTIGFGKFGNVTLLTENSNPMKFSNNVQYIYSLSGKRSGSIPRYFLAQTLPVALKEMQLETEKDENENMMVCKGETLSFSTLADMAEGDKRIGVLKMDVDNLGMIFSVGLDAPPSEKEKAGGLRSISRLSALSRQLSFFFTVHVDDLCRTIFEEWRNNDKNKWQYKMDVSSIFYLIFAGGDDLAIVGPWDKIIDLAERIRKAFKDFTCHNPNITLSAGVYICKPKTPISIAAEKSEEALKQSKERGRNRITVMGETFIWGKEDSNSRVYQSELREKYPPGSSSFDENEINCENIYLTGGTKKTNVSTLTFETLGQFARQLQKYYEEGHISRHFIFRLLNARTKFFTTSYNDNKNHFEEEHNFMFLPHLLYNIERNTAGNAKIGLKELLVTTGDAQKYIRQAYYPCKAVLMKTKK